MNRINTMIDRYGSRAAMCALHVRLFTYKGFIEQADDMTDRMIEARRQLQMWVKISQAIRGWKL